jgi:UDP-N-acetylglucosamine diphosphorylase/glucosamine-1-phosphate N-acetyltransferase
MRIYSYEDAAVGFLEPLTATRPAFDLLLGMRSLLARQREHFAGAPVGAILRPLLRPLVQALRPDLPFAGLTNGTPGLVLVNARWVAPTGTFRLPERPTVGRVGDEIAWLAWPHGLETQPTWDLVQAHAEAWSRELAPVPAGGWLVRHPWQLVDRNPEYLTLDASWWRDQHPSRSPDSLTVVGPPESVLVHPTAKVEPFVVFDTTRGPVVVDEAAKVQSFTRLEGPCYVGPRTQLLAAQVRGGTLGVECRVGGEFEASILHGYSNKYHDGFLGHSYLGEWVNVGAGAQFSDLRNDYGSIEVFAGGRMTDSGRIKVGSFVGDHTRFSINASMNCGTVVGPFCMMVASGGLLPRVVPAFSMAREGRVTERNDLRKMFDTATMAMSRRGQTWTPAHEAFYFDLYEATVGHRDRLLGDPETRRQRRRVS